MAAAPKRTGLGRGIGALIPTGPLESDLADADRPVDVFFGSDTDLVAVPGARLAEIELTDIVQAVNNAEIALQTVVAVRDRVIDAYQQIIRMPI